MDKIKQYFKSDGGTTILSSIVCVVLGLIIGLIILLIIKPSYGFSGFGEILTGGFILPSSIAIALSNAASLILVGLSVTFAFKCGLFNIGVAGQYVMGILGCLAAGLLWQWNWFFALLFGGLLGALWGVIPGLLKTYCNVNEVISAIMTNWIALFLVNDLIKNSSMYDSSRLETHPVSGSVLIPKLFSFANGTAVISWALVIAIIIAIVSYIFINKTKYGYELRACGLNKDAAKYSGINHRKNIIVAMGGAGMFAGLAAGLYFLSNTGQYNPNISSVLPQMGFDGIAVSLIGGLNPIGGIFSAFLLAFLSRGSTTINPMYFPKEMATLIFGVIIYLCAFNSYFKEKIAKLLNKVRKKPEVEQGTPTEDSIKEIEESEIKVQKIDEPTKELQESKVEESIIKEPKVEEKKEEVKVENTQQETSKEKKPATTKKPASTSKPQTKKVVKKTTTTTTTKKVAAKKEGDA